MQTTTDVNVVMQKIETLDQKLAGGQHPVSIGVMSDAAWLYYWYLRDYTHVCYGFSYRWYDQQPAVILATAVSLVQAEKMFSVSANRGIDAPYVFHQYSSANMVGRRI